MRKIYIFPAFFAASLFTATLLLSSCSKEDRKPQQLFDFSEVSQEFTKLPATKSKTLTEKEKQTAEVLSEIKQPEKALSAEASSKEIHKTEEKQAEKTEMPDLPHFVKKYNVGYLSFDVADIILEVKGSYVRIFSKTNGFIDYLFGWRDYTISHFKFGENRFIPADFKTKLLFKKKIREIKIVYGDDGKGVSFENVTPPDNRSKRPAVPDDLKKSVYDPLTAALEARRMVMKTVGENNFSSKGMYNFSLPIYEGRRRTDLMFTLSKRKVDDMYLLKLYRKPIAGYTNNEMSDIKKGDAVIDIYLDKTTFIPVRAEGRNFIGTARLNYIMDCKDFESCVSER